MITITEALAEVKLVKSKIDKKKNFIMQNLARQEGAKDQLAPHGGTRQVIDSEMQAVRDLIERLVRIRSVIASANALAVVDVCGIKRSISDWLVWRRDAAPLIKDFERSISVAVEQMKGQARKQNFAIVSLAESARNPTDIIIEIDEKKFADSSEKIQEILDSLDGKLSLHNATVQVEV